MVRASILGAALAAVLCSEPASAEDPDLWLAQQQALGREVVRAGAARDLKALAEMRGEPTKLRVAMEMYVEDVQKPREARWLADADEDLREWRKWQPQCERALGR